MEKGESFVTQLLLPQFRFRDGQNIAWNSKGQQKEWLDFRLSQKFNVGRFNIFFENGEFLKRSFYLCENYCKLLHMYMYMYIYISITQNLEVKWNKCSFERVSAPGMINWKGFSLQGGEQIKRSVRTARVSQQFCKIQQRSFSPLLKKFTRSIVHE